MKLLKSIFEKTSFEKTIEKSSLFLKVVTALETLTKDVRQLGIVSTTLMNAITAHNRALQELYAANRIMMNAIKSNVVDVNVLDSKTKEPVKPN